MSTSLLGSYFDLHGGGEDLKFPHHENEIAQSCAACDAPFVHIWMHNGFVRVNEEKMSKSLGNFFTVREVLKTLRDPEVLRFFLLSSHYRGPINYSAAQLAQADETLLGLYRALKDTETRGTVETEEVARFHAAMDDDFNTPDALAVLQGVARDLNLAKAAANLPKAGDKAATLRALGAMLGILQQDPDKYLKRGAGAKGLSDAQVEALLASRNAARAAKNFAESDRIRAQLNEAGILLDDKAGGSTQWRRA
jgi:cysteinyl-tRNA synthetase